LGNLDLFKTVKKIFLSFVKFR